MSETTAITYQWQRTILEALTERRPECLNEKICAAERAICQRLRQRPNQVDELLALKDALHALQVLFLQSERTEPRYKQTIA